MLDLNMKLWLSIFLDFSWDIPTRDNMMTLYCWENQKRKNLCTSSCHIRLGCINLDEFRKLNGAYFFKKAITCSLPYCAATKINGVCHTFFQMIVFLCFWSLPWSLHPSCNYLHFISELYAALTQAAIKVSYELMQLRIAS